MLSAADVAKQAFVRCLLALASACAIQVNSSRDSDEASLRTAYGRVQRCGKSKLPAKADELKQLKVAWELALRKGSAAGGPPPSSSAQSTLHDTHGIE